MNKLSSKQRSHLIGLSSRLESEFQLGKDGVTPSYTDAIREALDKNELIKIKVLRTVTDDKRELAQLLADRTGSEVVTVIGSKIVLFKYQKDRDKRKIEI